MSSKKISGYSRDFKLKVLEYYFKHGGDKKFGLRAKTAHHFRIDHKTVSRMLCNPEIVKKARRALTNKNSSAGCKPSKPPSLKPISVVGVDTKAVESEVDECFSPGPSKAYSSQNRNVSSQQRTQLSTEVPVIELPEDPDYSVLKRTIESSASASSNFARLLITGTPEVRRLISNECDLIFECKVCRNLFRSVVNFLAHKRVYCQENYSNVKSLFRKDSGLNMTNESSTVIVEPKSPPSEVSSESTSNLQPNKCELKIDQIASRLAKSQKKSKGCEEVSSSTHSGSSAYYDNLHKVNELRKSMKTNCSVLLQDIAGIPSAVYQSFIPPKCNKLPVENKQEVPRKVHPRKRAQPVQLDSEGKVMKKKEAKVSPSVASSKTPPAVVKEPEDERIFPCSSCSSEFCSKSLLHCHVEEVHGLERSVYTCPICNMIFLTIWGCVKHLIRIHKKKKHQRERLKHVICSRAYSKLFTRKEIAKLTHKSYTPLAPVAEKKPETPTTVAGSPSKELPVDSIASRVQLPTQDESSSLNRHKGLRNRSQVQWECNVCSRTFLSKSACLAHQSSHVLSAVQVGAVKRISEPKAYDPLSATSVQDSAIQSSASAQLIGHSTPKKLREKNPGVLDAENSPSLILEVEEKSENSKAERVLRPLSLPGESGLLENSFTPSALETSFNSDDSDNFPLSHYRVSKKSDFSADVEEKPSAESVCSKSFSWRPVSRFDIPCSFLRFIHFENRFGSDADLLFHRLGFKEAKPVIKLETLDEAPTHSCKEKIEEHDRNIGPKSTLKVEMDGDLSSYPDMIVSFTSEIPLMDTIKQETGCEMEPHTSSPSSVNINNFVICSNSRDDKLSSKEVPMLPLVTEDTPFTESKPSKLVPFKLFFSPKHSKSQSQIITEVDMTTISDSSVVSSEHSSLIENSGTVPVLRITKSPTFSDNPNGEWVVSKGVKVESDDDQGSCISVKVEEEMLCSPDKDFSTIQTGSDEEYDSVPSKDLTLTLKKINSGMCVRETNAHPFKCQSIKRSYSADCSFQVAKKTKAEDETFLLSEDLEKSRNIKKPSLESVESKNNESPSLTNSNTTDQNIGEYISKRNYVSNSPEVMSPISASTDILNREPSVSEEMYWSGEDPNELSVKILPKAAYSAKPRKRNNSTDNPRYKLLLENALARKGIINSVTPATTTLPPSDYFKSIASTSKNPTSPSLTSSKVVSGPSSFEAVTVSEWDLQSNLSFGRLSFEETSLMPSETLHFPLRKEKAKSKPEISVSSLPRSCPRCAQSFSSPSAMGSHQQFCPLVSLPTNLQAETPEKKIAIQIRKDYKKEVVGPSSSPIPVMQDKWKFEDKTSLEIQTRIKEICNIDQLLCNPCKKRYNTITVLKRHVAHHLGWTRFVCKRCSFRSYDKYICTQHCLTMHRVGGKGLDQMVLKEEKLGSFRYYLTVSKGLCQGILSPRIDLEDNDQKSEYLQNGDCSSPSECGASIISEDSSFKGEFENQDLETANVAYRELIENVDLGVDVKEPKTNQDKESKGNPDIKEPEFRAERPQRMRKAVEQKDFVYEMVRSSTSASRSEEDGKIVSGMPMRHRSVPQDYISNAERSSKRKGSPLAKEPNKKVNESMTSSPNLDSSLKICNGRKSPLIESSSSIVSLPKLENEIKIEFPEFESVEISQDSGNSSCRKYDSSEEALTVAIIPKEEALSPVHETVELVENSLEMEIALQVPDEMVIPKEEVEEEEEEKREVSPPQPVVPTPNIKLCDSRPKLFLSEEARKPFSMDTAESRQATD